MKISDFSPSERPREKLLARGPRALGTAELLAILLRTGTRDANVLDLAHRLFSRAGGRLTRLAAFCREDLCALPGIKSDKAATLLAAFELGRRFLDETQAHPADPIRTPEQVYQIMIPTLKGLTHEECWVLMVNQAQRLIDRQQMTLGGSVATTIDVKDIIRRALDRGAQGLILVHNHPSGDPRPGQADISETKALQKAARSMELTLLDHIIVCDDAYYSFTDERTVQVL
ncbi:MAG: DNA repair protein RadC [Bacteroidales bacterium]|nr:DNA repair protein RadC [Bacteroidales bacterium]